MADVKAKFKVGDRVSGSEDVVSHWNAYYAHKHGRKDAFTVTDVQLNYSMGHARYQLEGAVWWTEDKLSAVSSQAIRTVTRREIVSGNYDGVEVSEWADELHVRFDARQPSASDLRAAAKLFNEIADVLEEAK